MNTAESIIESEKRNAAAVFTELATTLAQIGCRFYDRGWMLGTSGNLSAVIGRDPVRLAVTRSGVDKGALTADHILRIDATGAPEDGVGRPSAETLLHLAIVRARDAGAVVHTHSVWGALVSDALAKDGGVMIEGYEMLKGLDGIRTHDHREWVPILENAQDYVALSQSVESILKQYPGAHGFLLRRHGLYTWGRDLAEAKRHVEILEFLLEAVGRTSPAVNGRL